MQEGEFRRREGEERPWWEHPALLFALVLASAVPLLWPDIPPLLDLPGHMGRYRVQLDLDQSPILQRYYHFEWALIGNLGVDLLVELLAPLIGLEPAVKLIILLIPPLTVTGLLWTAYEVHGRLPPTAFFAIPFAYNFPFLFGFANFSLSMALALVAFAYWLRLGRLGRVWIRAALFLLISPLLWVVHAFGWGTLGVLAFSSELVRQFDRGHNIVSSAIRSGIHCLALAPPAALVLLWRSEASGMTGDWFNLAFKTRWMLMALRDRWQFFDLAGLMIVISLLVVAKVSPRMEYSRILGTSAALLALVYLLLPRLLFGSNYTDMRLAPYLFAIGLIAIRFPVVAERRFVQAFAVAALIFVGARFGGNTISAWLYDRSYDRELAALDHIPRGARLVSFVGRPCEVDPWALSRLLHLPGLALARREAFSNDQWVMAGAQLLEVRYRAGHPFTRDPSQIVTERPCSGEVWNTAAGALSTFPREAFDYVWLIDPPTFDPDAISDLRPIWRNARSTLFHVDGPTRRNTRASNAISRGED